MQDLQGFMKDTTNPYEYYFSEVSVFMHIGEITSIPSSWKNGLINLLKEVVQNQNIQEKKWLLLKTKIRYNLRFGTLLRFLSYIEQDAQEEIHHMFRDTTEKVKDYEKFFEALPYIFMKNESYAEAFQKRGFNEEFGITHGAEGTVRCSPQIKGLILLSAAVTSAEYGLYQRQLMKIEKLHSKVLAIKKYEFTYNEMRAQFTSPSQKDIPITLILGTIDDEIIFYEVAFKNLSESQFINSVQRLVLKAKIPYRFVFLIHAYHDYVPLARLSLTSLLKLAQKINTRVHISNLGEEFSENIMLFAYIYSEIAQKSQYPYQVFASNFAKDIDLQIAKIKKMAINQKVKGLNL